MFNRLFAYSIFSFIFGTYSLYIGWQNVFRDQKKLDLYTAIMVKSINVFRGPAEAQKYMKKFVQSNNYKLYGIFYLVNGVLFLLILLLSIFEK